MHNTTTLHNTTPERVSCHLISWVRSRRRFRSCNQMENNQKRNTFFIPALRYNHRLGPALSTSSSAAEKAVLTPLTFLLPLHLSPRSQAEGMSPLRGTTTTESTPPRRRSGAVAEPTPSSAAGKGRAGYHHPERPGGPTRFPPCGPRALPALLLSDPPTGTRGSFPLPSRRGARRGAEPPARQSGSDRTRACRAGRALLGAPAGLAEPPETPRSVPRPPSPPPRDRGWLWARGGSPKLGAALPHARRHSLTFAAMLATAPRRRREGRDERPARGAGSAGPSGRRRRGRRRPTGPGPGTAGGTAAAESSVLRRAHVWFSLHLSSF